MSNTSTFALGLGSGLAFWYATKHASKSKDSAPPKDAGSPMFTPPHATPPPRQGAPDRCAVRIDLDGVSVDGDGVDVTEAVRRCVESGHASLIIARNAPASTCAALMSELAPHVTTLRNARRQSGVAQGKREVHSTFTLVVFPEGVWGTTKRVRYFTAEPPTTWEDARDRLRAAKLLDPDAHSPNLAGAWRLVVDPARFRADRAEPLPGETRRRDASRAPRGKQRYSREGRTILRDGEEILRIDRVDQGDGRYGVSPHQADQLTERVVRLLNKHGAR